MKKFFQLWENLVVKSNNKSDLQKKMTLVICSHFWHLIFPNLCFFCAVTINYLNKHYAAKYRISNLVKKLIYSHRMIRKIRQKINRTKFGRGRVEDLTFTYCSSSSFLLDMLQSQSRHHRRKKKEMELGFLFILIVLFFQNESVTSSSASLFSSYSFTMSRFVNQEYKIYEEMWNLFRKKCSESRAIWTKNENRNTGTFVFSKDRFYTLSFFRAQNQNNS